MADHDGVVLVSGATGKQGGAVARELLGRGWTVRAMTRHPEGAAATALAAQGVEVVQADLDDDASLRRALPGAWGALAIQNTWEAGVEREEVQGKRFAHAARDAGIEHLVYHSVASAHRNTGIPHFDNKWRIEETIRSLGFPSHVVIRPVFFMENLLGPDFRQGIANGVLALAIRPETKLQSMAVRDVGAYGRVAFERAKELNGRAIDVAGDELTGPEMAEVLSDVTGRAVRFQPVPIEQVRAFSEDAALMFEWFDAVGYDVDIDGTSAEFGVPPTRFRDWAAAQRWD